MKEPKEFKSFYKTVGGGELERCKYPTRLDLYGCGCFHDCAYCYAKSLLSFRGLWNPETPAVADFEKVKRKISKLEPGTIVRLGGMTDCFQPIESEQQITYKTIQELNRCGIGYLIVTKSHLIATEKYMSILDKDLAHIQISISCTNDNLGKSYEKSSLVSKRLQAVKILQERGFDCTLRLSPLIPEFIDFNVVAEIQPKKILVEFLRINSWIEKWLGDKVDLTKYSVKSGGYRHLPLEQKVVVVQRLRESVGKGCELSVCEDVGGDWEYWRTHINHNPNDCCNLRIKQ